MEKEIEIIKATPDPKTISFRIKGLEDEITVELYPNSDGLSVEYKDNLIGVPFNADSGLIAELNDNSFPEDIEENILEDMFENGVNHGVK